MGAIRKPRFSNGDVEKAMDGFFNELLVACFVRLSNNVRAERLAIFFAEDFGERDHASACELPFANDSVPGHRIRRHC